MCTYLYIYIYNIIIIIVYVILYNYIHIYTHGVSPNALFLLVDSIETSFWCETLQYAILLKITSLKRFLSPSHSSSAFFKSCWVNYGGPWSEVVAYVHPSKRSDMQNVYIQQLFAGMFTIRNPS